jgi:hypothetical protein
MLITQSGLPEPEVATSPPISLYDTVFNATDATVAGALSEARDVMPWRHNVDELR